MPVAPIYLDNNATTRVAPEVLDAMLPFFEERWGNPSSAYRFGHDLAKPLDQAREQVARLLHADPRDLIFTSCGTESNNAALQSALASCPDKKRVVTTRVEHSATLRFCQALEKRGYSVTWLDVDREGALDLHLLEKAIGPDTAVVSVMWANNETGVIFPIDEIAAICRSRQALFHTDAVQAAGKIPLDAAAAGVDYLSLSAHKLHAPKGIGALYIRRRAPFHPYIIGGQQERGRRAGTENVPYMIGFGRAAELAMERLPEEERRVRELRDRFERSILASVPGTQRNGAAEPRLPNTSNLYFEGAEAEAILLFLDKEGICASSGSACKSGSLEPSHVLLGMGFTPARARSSIRFSFGFYNTEGEVDFALEKLPRIIERLRGLAPAPAPVSAA